MPTLRPRLTDLAPTLHGYQRAWLRYDVIAGLSAGAVVVPQAMAYATIADLPVQYGLYTCMVPMVVYALLGGSHAMSVSTTSTIAVLTATTLTAAGVAASAHDKGEALMTLTLMVGVILLLARLVRLGGLVENISHATTIGVKVGVGLTVAAAQLPSLLGVPSDPDAEGFIAEVRAALSKLDQANAATVLLSAATIVMLLALRRYAPRVPGPLVAVAVGVALIAFTALQDHGVAVISPVPHGIPAPSLPSLHLVGDLLPGALAISFMAFLETASVSRALRTAKEPQIDSNRELLANGTAALAGAFFHAMPPAGGFSQSAVNLRAGARTQASGLVTAALAVLVALFLAPVLDDLPQATLGAMVVVATVSLVDVGGLMRLWRIERLEFWVAALTAVVGLTQGLLAAVLVGVLATLYLVLRELNRPRVVVVSGGEPDDDAPLVLRFDGALYTANVRANFDTLRTFVEHAEAQMIVLDLSRLPLLPVMVADELRDLDGELAADGVHVLFSAISGQAAATAERTHWWHQVVAEGRVFDSTSDAQAYARGAP